MSYFVGGFSSSCASAATGSSSSRSRMELAAVDRWPPTADVSGQDLLDHFPMHVGEPEVPALKAIRELRVVDAEEMENRRLQVVDRHGIGRDVVAEVIRLAE